MALDVEMRRKEETSANVGREERREGREGEEGGRGGRERREEREGGGRERREGEEEGEGGRGGGRGREREEGEGGRGGRWNEEERIWISSTSYYMYIHVPYLAATTPSRTYFALQKCWHQRVKKIKNRVACTQRSHDVASDKS